MPTTSTSTAINTSADNKGIFITEYEQSIISAAVRRVVSMARILRGVSLSQEAGEKVEAFLIENELNNMRVYVRFDDVPSQTVIIDGDYCISLAFEGKSDQNLLTVGLEKTPEAKFRNFCGHRNLPLVEEMLPLVDLNHPVRILSYPSAGEWNKTVKELHDGVYIGQTPNKKTGSFVPNRPIGLVFKRINTVILTNPILGKTWVNDFTWDPDYSKK